MSTPSLLLSVVIPFNGNPALPHVIRSLQTQTLDPTSFEVIVVCEVGNDVDPRLFESCEFSVSFLSYEPAPGSRGHSAGPMRNMGIRFAAAERLVFVDSDCMLGPTCLAEHASQNGVVALCGVARELPAAAADRLVTCSYDELWVLSTRDPRESADMSRTRKSTWREFYTCNASASRSSLIKAGLFDEAGYRCHDLDIAYRLHLIGIEFQLNFNCEVIHLEHPRSIWFRDDQAKGWLRIAEKHPELRTLALDKEIEMQRSLYRTINKADERFTRITSSLPGIRCGTTWVFPENTSTDVVNAALFDVPFVRIVRKGAIEIFLRLVKNCWDYSFLLPEPVGHPLVSIVIAARDAEQSIQRAVESALRQTEQSFELIVVDDGCTDLTRKKLTPYAVSKRLRVLTNPSNRGLSHSLNRALDVCRGTFFLQLDADDWLEPDALERLTNAFPADTEIGAIYGAPRVLADKDGRGKVARLEAGFPVSTPLECLMYPRLQAPRIYRVDALKAVGGWKIDDAFEGRFFEDRVMLARIAERYRLSFLPKAVYTVVERNESLSRKTPLQAASAKLAILHNQAAIHGTTVSYSFSGGLLLAKRFTPVSSTRKLDWSIIIPFSPANDPVILALALASWLKSDVRDRIAEIIVVVDGPESKLGDAKLPESPTIRFVYRNERGGAGAARNTGARLAKFDHLFFSDSDRIVPPNILQSHEMRHSELGSDILVVGDVFGRRTFSVVPPDLSHARIRRLLEIVRFQPEFLKIAEAVIRRERVQLLDHACPDPWNEAQRFAFTDSWQARWGAILLQYGEDLKYFPHKWLRVGAGSLSMRRTTFQSLGFFDETIAAMEDWEFGARAQERGYSIVCAPEAEPLHQIHSVSEERVQAETDALTPLEQKHSEIIEHLRRASPDLIPPGGEQFVSVELRAKHIEQRLKSSIATRDPSGCDEFVLSFDDGPHYQNTNLVLDGLKAVGAPGVFFVLGNRVKHNAEVLRRCSQEGHEIGIHGWYHRSWSRLTCAELNEEISRTIGQVENIIGHQVNYCRPPYGNLPEHAKDALSDHGLQVIGWNLSSRDWVGYSNSELVIELASQSLRGKVLLFHDGFGEPASTAAAVRWLVPAASRAGLRPVSISHYLKKYIAPECGAVNPPRLLQSTCP